MYSIPLALLQPYTAQVIGVISLITTKTLAEASYKGAVLDAERIEPRAALPFWKSSGSVSTVGASSPLGDLKVQPHQYESRTG